MKEKFLQALHGKKKLSVTFYSKEDGRPLTRKCAPFDIGPSRRAHNKEDRFHMWDYESDTWNHVLSLLPNQLIEINILDEDFNPGDLITWSLVKSPWFTPRDWGQYS